MNIATQYVFNKNSYEVFPWYPQLEIIRPFHKEMIFGIPATLAEKLKDRAFAEKWLRTASIINGEYAAGDFKIPPAAPEPSEFDDEDDDLIPPELNGLDAPPMGATADDNS